ncbi:hypothetical protein KEM54_006702, partial [Ascosphaera aggregata]
LKHCTSKLSTYDDISTLTTFGFRGEALSSLCALSDLRITTAQEAQAPKASRLEFEPSGKVKSVQVVAGQKGTTASVEYLFRRLPVRRKELEKNIKREYTKLVTLLQAYACINTNVRFSVKSQMPRGKSATVFNTNGNAVTRENISNIYGAKTVNALVPLALELAYKPSLSARRVAGQTDDAMNQIVVRGHISKPVFGEGRHTPDRQMFFVNRRPCVLPQIAKAFNEVYKSFNISQSPFIFANFEMDTSAYDVNVSPDKRTILLHDAGFLIESLKEKLTELFDSSDQTVPQSQTLGRQQSFIRSASAMQLARTKLSMTTVFDAADANVEREALSSTDFGGRFDKYREPHELSSTNTSFTASQALGQGLGPVLSSDDAPPTDTLDPEDVGPKGSDQAKTFPIKYSDSQSADATPIPSSPPIPSLSQSPTRHPPGPVQNAFDRMRPMRPAPEVTQITVGNRTVQSRLDGSSLKRRSEDRGSTEPRQRPRRHASLSMMQKMIRNSLSSFRAPGSDLDLQDIYGDREMKDDEMEEEQEEQEREVEEGEDYEPPMDCCTHHEDLAGHQNEAECSGEDIGALHIQSDCMSLDEHDSGPCDNYEVDRRRENARVAALIRQAESRGIHDNEQKVVSSDRSPHLRIPKSSTQRFECSIDLSLDDMKAQMESLRSVMRGQRFQGVTCPAYDMEVNHLTESEEQAENRLSLAVTKEDFSDMTVVGQFNLGFILAVRPRRHNSEGSLNRDELFIIDQHASDEIYNFERLRSETVIQNQMLVQPKTLDLTAVEEEIIIDNIPLLEKNGFVIDVDTSGDEPIGRRCRLISLPLSKEVVFGLQDLEELIVLLSESPSMQQPLKNDGMVPNHIPRPSKVRKMLAMRACRSSIMIGRPLTQKQMETVLQHMGTMDKPWNCPHGRPTMRHLMTLDNWVSWNEFCDRHAVCTEDENDDKVLGICGPSIWRKYIKYRQQQELAEQEESEGDTMS